MKKTILLSIFYILIGLVFGIFTEKYILNTYINSKSSTNFAIPIAKYKVVDEGSRKYFGDTLEIGKDKMTSEKKQKWNVISSHQDNNKGIIVFQKSNQNTGNIYNIYHNKKKKEFKLVHVIGGQESKSSIVLQNKDVAK